MGLGLFAVVIFGFLIREDIRWERGKAGRKSGRQSMRRRRWTRGYAMLMRLLNKVLGLVGVKLNLSVERKPKDRYDEMLVGRKTPTERRDWN